MKTDILMNGSMVKNHISFKTGFELQCNTENFVLIVVPGLSTSASSGSDPLTSRTLSRQESHCSTYSSSSSSSPTESDTKTRERENRIEGDISPVTVSTTVYERSVSPVVDQANKNPKTNKKRIQRQNGETRAILRFRNGCKNSGKIWWMMKFHYREALTPVLLMKLL